MHRVYSNGVNVLAQYPRPYCTMQKTQKRKICCKENKCTTSMTEINKRKKERECEAPQLNTNGATKRTRTCTVTLVQRLSLGNPSGTPPRVGSCPRLLADKSQCGSHSRIPGSHKYVHVARDVRHHDTFRRKSGRNKMGTSSTHKPKRTRTLAREMTAGE